MLWSVFVPRLQNLVTVRSAIAAGLLLRLCALVLYWRLPLASDAVDYCDMARRLAHGELFVPYWPPGLPLFLTPFAALGATDAVLRTTMLAFWLLAVWGIVRLGRDFGVERYVWLPLLFFGVLPVAVHQSIEPQTQMPIAALVLLALSAAIRLSRGPSLWADGLLLGVAGGSMVLVRPSSALLLVLFFAVALVRVRPRLPVLVSMLMAGVLICGWMAYAHGMCGRYLVNTANAANLWYGNNPSTPMYRTWFFGSHAKLGTDEIHAYPAFESTLAQVSALSPLDQPAVFSHLATDYIEHHPGTFVLRSANRVRCFFGFDVFTALNLRRTHPGLFAPVLLLEATLYLAMMLPAVFWLAAAPRAFWRQIAVSMTMAAVVLYALPYWLSMSHPTYHFPVLVPLAILGLAAWHTGGTPDRSRRLRGWIAVAALLAVQVEWVLQARSGA